MIYFVFGQPHRREESEPPVKVRNVREWQAGRGQIRGDSAIAMKGDGLRSKRQDALVTDRRKLEIQLSRVKGERKRCT